MSKGVMTSVKRILVPVDFSEPSKKSLPYAVSLATSFGARIILAHILPGALSEPPMPESGAFQRAQYDAARQDLANLLRDCSLDDDRVEVVVQRGEIHEALVSIVEDREIDLVVMGTHGRRNPMRWLTRSVTETLVRKLPVPVFTVARVQPGPFAIKRILYATDLQDESRQAFRFAAAFSNKLGADLRVLHVVRHFEFLWGATRSNYFRVQHSRMFKRAQRRLADFVRRETPAGMEVESLVIEGPVHEHILEAAHLQQADLIMIHPREKSSLDHVLFGSTAELIVRTADMPVLSIPSMQGGFYESQFSGMIAGSRPRVEAFQLTSCEEN